MRALSPRNDPQVAEQLRRIALHEETAGMLELRAQRAGSEPGADQLRRRADGHRAQARLLRSRLAVGARAGSPVPALAAGGPVRRAR